MFKDKFHRDVLKALLAISATLVLCRVTAGGMAVVIALVGAVCALQRKSGLLAVCYLLSATLMIFNRAIIGWSALMVASARFGTMFLIAVMILTGAGFHGRVRERVPILWLFAYCGVACISSLDGWAPMISYLKLAQYVFFLIGILFITRILQQSDRGLYQMRCAFMALAIIILVGSVIVRFIPSIGYSMQIGTAADWGITLTGEDIAKAEFMTMFNGMTAHSQMLAPTVSIVSAWVLCDMLLVEKRLSYLHLGVLSVAPILLYLSRSRGGFLELLAVIGCAVVVCVPRARLTAVVRSKLTMLMAGLVLIMFGIAAVMQFRNEAISRWLRKTDDVHGDNRTLTEAFTGSRAAMIEYNLRDFRLNPLFGKGFQVVRGMERYYRGRKGMLFSAPVEKGVTPYVVLGETGLAGATFFTIFLFSFYATCLKRRYLALLTMFTCMMVANLADSTFFSPGGGGFMWIYSCVGGFGIDLIAIRMAHGTWSGPDGKPSAAFQEGGWGGGFWSMDPWGRLPT